MGHSWNWKQTFGFFLLFVPALLFYALQKNIATPTQGTVFQKPAHWLQLSYDQITHKIQESLNTYFYLVNINIDNRELKAENASLASQMQLLEEYRLENMRLRELFKFQQELPRKTLPARVISKDILLNQKSIMIDKGLSDGVQRLQGVISADGVVGYIIEVEEKTARVMLASNHNASVDALVQRTRARGIVSGLSNETYRLNYIMRKEDAEVGDKIITSGRQGYFPKGFNIGTVTHVEHSPTGVSFQALIQPEVKLDHLEDVLVIVEKREDPDTEKTL